MPRYVGLSLALFALLFQAAIGFGHHHFDLAGKTAGGAVAQTVQGANRDPSGRQAPMLPKHDLCLVCLAIHASAPLAADAPRVALRGDAGTPVHHPALAGVSVLPRAAAFESRGPPLS